MTIVSKLPIMADGNAIVAITTPITEVPLYTQNILVEAFSPEFFLKKYLLNFYKKFKNTAGTGFNI